MESKSLMECFNIFTVDDTLNNFSNISLNTKLFFEEITRILTAVWSDSRQRLMLFFEGRLQRTYL